MKVDWFYNFRYNQRCGIQLLNVYKVINLATGCIFLCAYTTLQTYRMLNTYKVQRVFFSRLRRWVALKRACFCNRMALKRTDCLQQTFKMMPLRLQAYTQLCSPLINGLVDDALWNAPVTLYITLTRIEKYIISVISLQSKIKLVKAR